MVQLAKPLGPSAASLLLLLLLVSMGVELWCMPSSLVLEHVMPVRLLQLLLLLLHALEGSDRLLLQLVLKLVEVKLL